MLDANVLIYAHRPESPGHRACRSWLSGILAGEESVAVSDDVWAGFLRVVTHPKVFREPTPLEIPAQFCEAVRASPAVESARPGPNHWRLMLDLLKRTGGCGNDVPDAYLAALALERGATLVTADRGFARFEELPTTSPI